MRVVHLSTGDSGGGAFRAAHRLHTGLRRLGHDSKMLVLRSGTRDPNVIPIEAKQGLTGRWSRKVRAGHIWREYEKYRPTLPPGIEPFSDSRSIHPREIVQQLPDCDVITLHFVADFLDYASFFAGYPKHVPLVWRMADMSVYTGGCHYTQGCEKFTQQCGACPQLGSSDPNDLSRRIWNDKSASFARVGSGGLHVVGPSKWTAGEAKRSSLLGKFPTSVIPNGLDTDDFAPRDKGFCRDLWSIPRNARCVLFAAESVENKRKGFAQLVESLRGMAQAQDLLLLSVGGGLFEPPAGLPLRAFGKISNDRMLATLYSAADVFVIPALQESFGQTVIESLACGTPVVGFASGGIPDMVRPGQTGWLAPTGDTRALREAIESALRDPERRNAMAQICRQVAIEEYSLDVQARAYVRLYETLLARTRQTTPEPVVPNGRTVMSD